MKMNHQANPLIAPRVKLDFRHTLFPHMGECVEERDVRQPQTRVKEVRSTGLLTKREAYRFGWAG